MTNKQLCDRTVVAQFLNEELEGEQQQAFTKHLAECESCQTIIENAAAEDVFWQETIKQLGQSSTVERKSHAFGGSGVGFEASPMSAFDSSFGTTLSLTQNEGQSSTDQQVKVLLDALSPTDDPAMLGRIGDYEVSGVVGLGGMGAVFKGFDKSLMRVVAIKVMAPHLANKGSARKRFEREARAAAAISHHNVVDIYRVDELNGLPYLVMPFARGPSLQSRIDRDGPLSTIETVLVGRQIASGLAAAHEQGLVHRDIKPANILLNDGIERVLITDFGVARAMDDASMTQTGLIAGTPQFMSPEQARGEVVDQRSDLFSLGSLLYTICTGRPPFRAEAPFGVLRKITDAEPKSILDLNSEIPSWLNAIIHRLMQKDPAQRFEDAQEVAELFEKCLGHLRQPNLIELPESVNLLQAEPAIAAIPDLGRRNGVRSNLTWIAGTFVAIAMAVWGVLALTDAPDIAGAWQGEKWSDIKLNSVEEAQDWYTGSFTDASGVQGAIHLEWSRLGRRFQGRWSIGQGKSGAIVLRQGEAQSVRGAISFDSDAIAGQDELRLRDFVWRLGDAKLSKPTATQSRQAKGRPSGSERTLFAFSNAVVKRMAPDFAVGKRIERGDLLVELITENGLQPFEQKELEKLQTQLDVYKNALVASYTTYEQRVDQRRTVVPASDAKIEQVKSELESKTHLMAAYKAKAEKAKLEYEKTLRLREKRSMSTTELEVSKKDWEIAQAEYRSFTSEIGGLAKELDTLIQQAEAARDSMDQVVAAAKAKVDSATKDYQQARQKVEKLRKTKVANAMAQKIVAPVSGVVSKVYCEVGKPVSQGEALAVIQIEQKTITSDRKAPASSGFESNDAFPSPRNNVQDLAEPNKLPNPMALSEQTGQGFGLGSITEVLTFVTAVNEKIKATNKLLVAEEKRYAGAQELLAESQKFIENSQSGIQDLADQQNSDASSQSSREKLYRVRDVKDARNRIEILNRTIPAKVKKIESFKAELAELARQRDAMMELVQLQVTAAQGTLDQAKKNAVIRRKQFEQGDVTAQERDLANAKLSSAENNVKQLEVLLAHFRANENEPPKSKSTNSPLSELSPTGESSAQLPEEMKAINDLLKEIDTKQKSLNDLRVELTSTLAEIRQQRVEVDVRKKQMQEQRSALAVKKTKAEETQTKLAEILQEAESKGFVERNGKKINADQLKDMAKNSSMQLKAINDQLKQNGAVHDAWGSKGAELKEQEVSLSERLVKLEQLKEEVESKKSAIDAIKTIDAIKNISSFDNAEASAQQRLDDVLKNTQAWISELEAKLKKAALKQTAESDKD